MSLDFDGSGLRLRLAEGWQQVETGPEAAFAALHPDDGSGFRSSVVLTTSIVGALDAERWAAGTAAVLADRLIGFLLLDDAEARLGGLPARRLLVSYVDDAVRDLTLEQWSAVTEGRGIALSFTCATADYPRFRAVAQGIADSLEVAR